jgi:hypothetical protein
VGVELKDIASGTVLLYTSGVEDPFALKDIQSEIEHRVPIKSIDLLWGTAQVSPNRDMFAIMEWEYDEKRTRIGYILWIFDAKVNVLSKIAIRRIDLGELRWLDNERLLIDTEEYGVLLLIKVFTGEQETITNDLPNSYPYDKSHLYLWWPVTYSPDLQWVTYMTGRTEYGNVYMQGPIVYDLAAKQIIWNKANGVGSRPAWSPDGEALAFTGGMDEYQLFIFDRSGNIKGVLDDSLPHRAFEFSWSPDGSYIAFWTEDSLMVYDREQDWLFDTCIPGNFEASPGPVEWSPDSKQFIANQTSTEPLLIDWEKQRVYKIKFTESSSIYGWMNSIP